MEDRTCGERGRSRRKDLSYFKPLHCRQDAFTALRDQLPQLNTTDGLVRAAVAISMHELGDADLIEVESSLDDLARQVRERVVGDDPRALVAHAHHVLFEEARFRGNLGDYDNPVNSYLPRVLRTRLGLPITLTLIYKAVLERVGVPAVGINAPGHFLAGVPAVAVGALSSPNKLAFIDAFAAGRLLSREEALQRVINTAGGDLLLDENADLLPVATHKHWLLRMIRNLHMGFERRGQFDDVNAMAELSQLVQEEA